MWLVLGTKEKTERVPHGRQVERRCSQCGEVAMFYERRAVSTFQLYFLDVVDFRSRTVMACGACGTLYATDHATDHVGSREPSALETFAGAAEKVGSAIVSGAERAFDRATDVARGALRSAPEPRRPSDPEATDDPLADETAALEARFEELERRSVRVRVDT